MTTSKPKLARVQKIVLPILRGHNDEQDKVSVRDDLSGVHVGTWTEDIDYREFPLVNIRRLGGPRDPKRPTKFAKPVIEMTVYDVVDLPTTEDLYDTALEALYEAVRKQTQTPYGYLHSMKETMGATYFGSPFQDSWRVQGLIQLGVRPPRSTV